jgi:hypothetical protein
MTVARSQLVDVDVTPWYHVISKTVRGAELLRQGDEDRKRWIEHRLQFLGEIFAMDVAGYAVMDNHFHALVRLDPQRIDDWTDEEAVRRWAKLYPPRGKNRQPLKPVSNWVQQKLADGKFVGRVRQRLGSLSWFMKCLKEPLARLANKSDSQTGAFWQSRFKSIAVLGEEALLATCAYIDLNPVAAGLAPVPEDSEHTSLKTRVDHCRSKGRLADLQAARQSSAVAVQASRGLESGLWLCPIEDRRRQGSDRPGLMEGLSLGSYLQIVDYTSRLVRQGKARVSPAVDSILNRLGTSSEIWAHNLLQLFQRSKQVGIAFSFRREQLQSAASRRGCRRLANLNACRA